MAGDPDGPPNELDAFDALTAIAAGRLSAEALAAACLARIAERDSVVRAFEHVDRDRARLPKPAPAIAPATEDRCTDCHSA
jgi:Asp-tRNA(Asn)/Glu-tRNA(Gln) amidotransferase A subunit family amidase